MKKFLALVIFALTIAAVLGTNTAACDPVQDEGCGFTESGTVNSTPLNSSPSTQRMCDPVQDEGCGK